MKTDKQILSTAELKIKKGIIYLNFLSNLQEEEENIRLSELLLDKISKALDKNNYLIINFNKINNVSTTPQKTRKNYLALARNKNLKKTAIVGKNVKLKIIGKFVMGVAGKARQVNFFENNKAAEQWLRK